MKRILLVGNGAREHVIAETLKRSPQACELGVFAKAVNPGLKQLATEYELGALDDKAALKAFAERFKPDFAIVGPDNPIADGFADALLELGIKSVAPLQTLARLESSKGFTRELLEKYGIPGNPEFKRFSKQDEPTDEAIREFMEYLGEYVVKADGLHGGKGVKLSGEHLHSIEEGVAYAKECIEADGSVVIEEKFIGQEFSLMSFADGKTVVDMPAIQDHKRAYEGDTGPNTGGMGTWSDRGGMLPFLQQSDLEAAHDITEQVMKALYEETGKHYCGIMYGGFIAVKNGVRLIEYNARFGDPEAMNALTLLKTDFIALCEAMLEQRLGDLRVEFEDKATVLKYVVPEGYPDEPQKGAKIEIDAAAIPEGVRTYYASVDEQTDPETGEKALYLSGSRAIAFVGIGDSLEEAEQLAQSAVDSVKGPVFYRKDIGTKALIQKRLDMMEELRGG